MKNRTIIWMTVLILSIVLLSLAGCKNEPVHEHKYVLDESKWERDETNHWRLEVCECGDKREVNIEAHSYVKSSTLSKDEKDHWHDEECKCGVKRKADVKEHSYVKASIWSDDEANHWHESVCECGKEGDAEDKAGHSWNEGVDTTPATPGHDGVKTFTCTECDRTKEETIAALPPSGDFTLVLEEGVLDKTYDTAAVVLDRTKLTRKPTSGDALPLSGTDIVTVQYKKDTDTSYSTASPSFPGKYSAKIIVAETAEWEEKETVVNFEIKKITLTGTVDLSSETIADLVYNKTTVYSKAGGLITLTKDNTPGMLDGDEIVVTKITAPDEKAGTKEASITDATGDYDYYDCNSLKVKVNVQKKKLYGTADCTTVDMYVSFTKETEGTQSMKFTEGMLDGYTEANSSGGWIIAQINNSDITGIAALQEPTVNVALISGSSAENYTFTPGELKLKIKIYKKNLRTNYSKPIEVRKTSSSTKITGTIDENTDLETRVQKGDVLKYEIDVSGITTDTKIAGNDSKVTITAGNATTNLNNYTFNFLSFKYVE